MVRDSILMVRDSILMVRDSILMVRDSILMVCGSVTTGATTGASATGIVMDVIASGKSAADIPCGSLPLNPNQKLF